MAREKSSSGAKYPVTTVIKAAALLDALSESDEEMGVTSLSKTLGMGPSTIHRLLDTLVSLGYVHYNQSTRRYRLGIRLFQLGMRFLNRYNIISETQSALDELVAATGETAKLGVLFEGSMVYINVVECDNMLRFAGQIGNEAPPHCTAMGKLLLAMLTEQELEQTLVRLSPLRQCTPNSIINEDDLWAELQQIRSNDFAIDDEEFVAGSRGIAVPVRNPDDSVVAAVSISAPSARLSVEELLGHLPALLQAADALSQKVAVA